MKKEDAKKELLEEKKDFMTRWQKEFGSFEGSTRVSIDEFMEEMKRMMEFE